LNNTTLVEIYNLLRDIGAISNESEFSKEWLGRSECYMRMLRHKGAKASAGCMALVASKLQHYGSRMEQTKEHKRLGEKFIQLSNSCHQSIKDDALVEWSIK
jgi:hypothetical protein